MTVLVVNALNQEIVALKFGNLQYIILFCIKFNAIIYKYMLTPIEIDQIAAATARKLYKLMKEDELPPTEYVTVKEAARMIGISENHMRKLKDQFPHIKNGDKQQGRVLFLREGLIRNYAK